MPKQPKKIKVLVKEPNKDPEIREIDADLASMQTLVGGYIEHLRIGNFDLYFNEEGKLKGLPYNFMLPHPYQDVIVGTAFVTRGNRGLLVNEIESATKRVFGS